MQFQDDIMNDRTAYNDFLSDIEENKYNGNNPTPMTTNMLEHPVGFFNEQEQQNHYPGFPPMAEGNFGVGVNNMNFHMNPVISASESIPIPSIMSRPPSSPSPPSPQTASFNFTTDLNTYSSAYSTPSTNFDVDIQSQPPQFIPLPFNQNLQSSGNSASHQDHGVRILVQPKGYQIVNYNIYPAPELEFNRAFSEPLTVQGFLTYNEDVNNPNTMIEILEGFTNGDVQVLKVGQTRVTFPALHLNRMTPIKNTVQQNGASLGPHFAVTFKIGDFKITSHSFKLVSACNQIPEGVDVRPRKQKEKPIHSKMNENNVVTPVQTMESVSSPQISVTGSAHPKAVKTTTTKRRAMDDIPQEDEIFLHVKVQGDTSHRGFIALYADSSLRMARDQIEKSNNYPKNFRFWFAKMSTIVEPYQEDSIKAVDAVDGTCLILHPYDVSLQSVDNEILALWLSKKDMKEPLVPLVDLIRTFFSVYRAQTSNINELSIINSGISHFFANITKNQHPGMVSLEDFKLFLKFFGPAHDCLNRVLAVYREPYFHGFARHNDSLELLKGRPGYFLVRYSESQLKDGFFAFNVNKGNGYRDVVENYSIRYVADLGCFMFRNKQYKVLRDFVDDPEYSQILKVGLEKTTIETIKESKYKNEMDLAS
mmetsp:Transcript_12477/g.17283  ORF Transcript_12477/g.17283 Transcript_12477/m.17283 type:complete len:649 (+) Transcript_12477:94-2040(+)